MTYPRDQGLYNTHCSGFLYWSHPNLQGQTIGVQVCTDAQTENPMFCVRPGLGRYHLVWVLLYKLRNFPISEFIFLKVSGHLTLLRHPDCVQVSIYLDAAEGQLGHPRMSRQYKNLELWGWQPINARFKTIKSYAVIRYPLDSVFSEIFFYIAGLFIILARQAYQHIILEPNSFNMEPYTCRLDFQTKSYITSC